MLIILYFEATIIYIDRCQASLVCIFVIFDINDISNSLFCIDRRFMLLLLFEDWWNTVSLDYSRLLFTKTNIEGLGRFSEEYFHENHILSISITYNVEKEH